MSRADDQKRLMELEEELAGLLRVQEEEQPKLEPGKVLVSFGPAGEIAERFGIEDDTHLIALRNRVLAAGIVKSWAAFGASISLIVRLRSYWFPLAQFLNTHAEHPIIKRLVGLPAKMSADEEARFVEELREEFPFTDNPLGFTELPNKPDDMPVSEWRGESESS